MKGIKLDLSERKMTIPRKELLLLMHSQIIHTYPDLKTALETLIGKSNRSIERLPKQIQREYFFTSAYAKIVSQSHLEWEIDQSKEDIYVTVDSDLKACELCGEKSCKLLMPITNSCTHETLYVGTSCVGEFGRRVVKSAKKRISEQNALRRYIKLSRKYPDLIKQFLVQPTPYVHQAKFLLPDKLEQENRLLFGEIRKAAEEYEQVSGGRLAEIETRFVKNIGKYKESCERVQAYEEKASHEWLFPTSQLINNLIRRKKSRLVRELRAKTAIDRSTLPYIDDIQFMRDHLVERLKILFRNIDMEAVGVDERPDGNGYIVRIKGLLYFLYHTEICSDYAQFIIIKRPIPETAWGSILGMLQASKQSLDLISQRLVDLISAKAKVLSYSESLNEINIAYREETFKIPFEDTLKANIPAIIEGTRRLHDNTIDLIDYPRKEWIYRKPAGYQDHIAIKEVRDQLVILR